MVPNVGGVILTAVEAISMYNYQCGVRLFIQDGHSTVLVGKPCIEFVDWCERHRVEVPAPTSSPMRTTVTPLRR